MRPAARLAVLGLVTTVSLNGRGSAADDTGGYATSFEVGALALDERYRTDLYTQLGLRVAPIEPSQAGIDFSISAPLVPAPVLLLLTDLDFTFTVPLSSNVFVAPRVGATGLLFAAGSFGGATAGLNAGAGLVIRGEGQSVRFDITARKFPDFTTDETFTSFTIGYVWGPKASPTPSYEARNSDSIPIHATASRTLQGTTSSAP